MDPAVAINFRDYVEGNLFSITAGVMTLVYVFTTERRYTPPTATARQHASRSIEQN